MAERIVVNTSPLIAWGKMEVLDLIVQLPFEFVCPSEVKAEILAGASKGYSVIFPSWLQVLSLSAPLSPLALASLDAGEAAVIELAAEQKISRVCLDEIRNKRTTRGTGFRSASRRLAWIIRQSQIARTCFHRASSG